MFITVDGVRQNLQTETTTKQVITKDIPTETGFGFWFRSPTDLSGVSYQYTIEIKKNYFRVPIDVASTIPTEGSIRDIKKLHLGFEASDRSEVSVNPITGYTGNRLVYTQHTSTTPRVTKIVVNELYFILPKIDRANPIKMWFRANEEYDSEARRSYYTKSAPFDGGFVSKAAIRTDLNTKFANYKTGLETRKTLIQKLPQQTSQSRAQLREINTALASLDADKAAVITQGEGLLDVTQQATAFETLDDSQGVEARRLFNRTYPTGRRPAFGIARANSAHLSFPDATVSDADVKTNAPLYFAGVLLPPAFTYNNQTLKAVREAKSREYFLPPPDDTVPFLANFRINLGTNKTEVLNNVSGTITSSNSQEVSFEPYSYLPQVRIINTVAGNAGPGPTPPRITTLVRTPGCIFFPPQGTFVLAQPTDKRVRAVRTGDRAFPLPTATLEEEE